MKKINFSLFVIIGLILYIFSCGPKTYTATFMVWDKDSGEYRAHSQKEVLSDVSFKDIDKPSVSNTTYGGKNCLFTYWVDDNPGTSILEYGTPIADSATITSNKTFYAIYIEDYTQYLTLTAVDNEISVAINIEGNASLPNFVTLRYYKTGNYKYEDYTWDEGTKKAQPFGLKGAKITLKKGEKVYFYSNTNTTLSDVNTFLNITSTGRFDASGNVMSLVGGGTEIPNEGCFFGLFSENKKLNSAKNLLLPATTLKKHCYFRMFQGTTVVTPPALPAKTLAEGCYESMFEWCRSLTSAPDLPAETLPVRAYACMFKRCTNLQTSPILPAKHVPEAAYWYMFEGCEKLNSVTCYATSYNGPNALYMWLQNISDSGVFYIKDCERTKTDFWNTLPLTYQCPTEWTYSEAP